MTNNADAHEPKGVPEGEAAAEAPIEAAVEAPAEKEWWEEEGLPWNLSLIHI